MQCLERDFVLCEQLSQLPCVDEGFQSEMLMVCFCLNGRLQMSVDDEACQLSRGDALLCKPFTTIHRASAHGDSQAVFLFYSPQTVDHMLPANRNLANVLECVPSLKVHFAEEAMNVQVRPLLEMLCRRMGDRTAPFYSHTVFHLFSTLMFEVLRSLLCDENAAGQPAEGTAKPAGRAEALFRQFVLLLNEDGGRHRTIAYYADKICVTPKHLSKVLRQKTGVRPLAYIHRHAIQQIKLDLKLTDIPIAQLADKYAFGNASFFSQYVKAHLGMTPQAYRAQ